MTESDIDQQPGTLFGTFLGIASVIADTLETTKPSIDARRQLEKLEQSAHMIPQRTFTLVHEGIARWTRNQARGPRFDQLLQELDIASSRLGGLPERLDIAQQNHMWVARSKARVRLDHDNPAKRVATP